MGEERTYLRRTGYSLGKSIYKSSVGTTHGSFRPYHAVYARVHGRRATHYHADYVAPGWSRKLNRTGKIGRHIFYISPRVEKTIRAGA